MPSRRLPHQGLSPPAASCRAHSAAPRPLARPPDRTEHCEEDCSVQRPRGPSRDPQRPKRHAHERRGEAERPRDGHGRVQSDLAGVSAEDAADAGRDGGNRNVARHLPSALRRRETRGGGGGEREMTRMEGERELEKKARSRGLVIAYDMCFDTE